ncbi:MAG TPA: FliI/YscN family ATPase [Polyangiaceae bacterium]|nr:FliI/YscN family ATPase [Polyangiaceae bacterium]
MDLEALRAGLARTPSVTPAGRVRAVTGLAVRATLPGARIGEIVRIRRRGQPLDAEIVGFSSGEIVALALGDVVGVGPDDVVEATGETLHVRVGPALLGRVLDGLGRPLDGLGEIDATGSVPVDRAPPPALERQPVRSAMPTGTRAIDAFTTLGLGQRVGLFAGSGVGKSRLLASMARGARVDHVVVALVGERGREVGDFLRDHLGEEGRQRSVVVVSTSDAPALERLRAAQVATAIAESFRDQGKSVLLLVDSITRVARAQRDVGLAAGEPPVRRGYPPSVFSVLPRLLERSGQSARGSITALYTVLVEGDDMSEPVADEVRGLLDGHIVLDRELAARGHFPSVDVLRSLSRVMSDVASEPHQRAARSLRELLSAYESKRDLIALGAYTRGKDALTDRALVAMPELLRFLRQEGRDGESFEEMTERLQSLASRYSE